MLFLIYWIVFKSQSVKKCKNWLSSFICTFWQFMSIFGACKLPTINVKIFLKKTIAGLEQKLVERVFGFTSLYHIINKKDGEWTKKILLQKNLLSLSLLLFWLFYQFTTFIAEHANIRIFRQIDRWWSKM